MVASGWLWEAQSFQRLRHAVDVVLEEMPAFGVPALLSDGMDGVWGALVIIAPGLPGMVDGGRRAGMGVALVTARNKPGRYSPWRACHAADGPGSAARVRA